MPHNDPVPEGTVRVVRGGHNIGSNNWKVKAEAAALTADTGTEHTIAALPSGGVAIVRGGAS